MEKDEPMFSYAYKYTMHRILHKTLQLAFSYIYSIFQVCIHGTYMIIFSMLFVILAS